MSLAAWMKHAVITVKPRDSARHAREVMEQYRINQLPVVVDDRLVGILTDRDLRDAFPSVFESAMPFAPRPHRSGADPAPITVEDVSAPPVLPLAPTASGAAAARVRRGGRIGAVPIADHGRRVGILPRSDVLDAFVELSRSAPEPFPPAG